MSQPDLEVIGGRIASQIIPGWQVSWIWSDANTMGGDLAKVVSMPTRSKASVAVVWPWPDGESLEETLWHELTHAALSPLTDLIKMSPSSVMIEEPIVERISVLLARVPLGASRAMGRAIQGLPDRIRARVTATRRQTGRYRMDAKAVLAAIKDQDEAAALKILEDWLSEQITGKDTATDGGDVLAKEPVAGAADAAGDDADMARGKSRHAIVSNGEIARMRRTMSAIESDGISSLIAKERTLGSSLSTEAEKQLLSCKTRDDAERLIAFGRVANGQARARSGATGASAGADAVQGDKPLPVTREKLLAEGFDEQWIGMYTAEHRADPAGAQTFLEGARSRRASVKNPWAAPKGSN